MIRSLRIFFLTRALREKLLLLAFIAIGLLWWLSAWSKRAAGFWNEQQRTTARLNEQSMWINNRETIESRAQKTAARLDPQHTLNANQLVAAVNQMARDAGLTNNARSGSPVTTPGGQFLVHSLDYTISGAEWGALTKFYEALQTRAPYIAIDRFILASQTGNPSQLTVQLRVVSVEIVRQ